MQRLPEELVGLIARRADARNLASMRAVSTDFRAGTTDERFLKRLFKLSSFLGDQDGFYASDIIRLRMRNSSDRIEIAHSPGSSSWMSYGVPAGHFAVNFGWAPEVQKIGYPAVEGKMTTAEEVVRYFRPLSTAFDQIRMGNLVYVGNFWRLQDEDRIAGD